MNEIVDLCPGDLTGADFRALVNEAAMNAVRRVIASKEQSESNNDDGGSSDGEACTPEHRDFVIAANNVQPSVTSEQLESYKKMHRDMNK